MTFKPATLAVRVQCSTVQLTWQTMWCRTFNETEIKVKQNICQQLHRQKSFIISMLFQHPHTWNELFYLLHSMRHVTWLNSRW